MAAEANMIVRSYINQREEKADIMNKLLHFHGWKKKPFEIGRAHV